jgi:hypothetical protein
VHLGVAKTALGTIDAKTSAVIGAERRSHVMVAITFSTEATKSPRIHFAALARKFTLLLRVQDMILDMQKRAGWLLTALFNVKLANWQASDVVLVQVIAHFAHFAHALPVVFANFTLVMTLEVVKTSPEWQGTDTLSEILPCCACPCTGVLPGTIGPFSPWRIPEREEEREDTLSLVGQARTWAAPVKSPALAPPHVLPMSLEFSTSHFNSSASAAM